MDRIRLYVSFIPASSCLDGSVSDGNESERDERLELRHAHYDAVAWAVSERQQGQRIATGFVLCGKHVR